MKKDMNQMLDNLKEFKRNEDEQLSEDEKDRIFNMVMTKIGEEKSTTKRKTFLYGKRIAAVVAVFLVLSIGTVVGAAILHMDNKMARFFSVEGDKKAEENVEVQNVKIASQEIDNVKVTADQVIGDDHSVFILFHLTGISPEATDVIMRKCDVKIEGVKGIYTVNDPVCSGYEENDPYFILEIRTAEDVSDKNIHMSIGKIGYTDLEDKFVTLSKGGYNLSWKLNYHKNTKELNVNKPVQIYGGSAVVNKISISPLSVTVYLRDIKNTMRETDKPNDRIRVVMKDGVIYDSYRMDSGNALNDYDVISLGLHKIVKYEDIQEVQFAGITIPVNDNPNKVKTTLYTNEKMGLTIDMQDRLYNMVKATKVKSYYDKNFKSKVMRVNFVGKIKKYSLDMFSITKIEKLYTPQEIDELNPLCRYIDCANGCTYIMQVTEELPEGEVDAFADVINNEVTNLLPRIEFMD